MFASRDAAAMQEIEVINMDDGEDNVTTTSLASPPTSTNRTSQNVAVSPTSPIGTNYAPPSRNFGNDRGDQDSTSSEAEAMEETLFAMISNERLLPVVDYGVRSTMRATPISITGGANMPAEMPGASESDMVNDDDRTKMCDWYYEMSDFLKIDRATASRSLTLLDRFMAVPIHPRVHPRVHPRAVKSKRGCNIGNIDCANSSNNDNNNYDDNYDVVGVVVAASQNRDEYQLVALTALFLAIKLFERLNIQPEHVSYLSRGRYTSHEVIKMEMIMLKALEWKVCTADKADYVDAFLNVMFPNHRQHVSVTGSVTGSVTEESTIIDNSNSNCSNSIIDSDNSNDHSNDQADPLLCSLKDLANLQIQLSDFESSFSTQKQSMVAFASVINAFEMKKDDISNVDQLLFLESVQRLMNKMYTNQRRRERHHLARMVDRLRVLVDPPKEEGKNGPHGNGKHQRYQHPSYNNAAIRSSGNVDASITMSSSNVETSPLDVALESMENFDMAQLLCCGHDHAAGAGDVDVAMATSSAAEGAVMEGAAAATGGNPIESVSSFGSADNSANKKRNRRGRHNSMTNHSPTSIATILFGSGSA